MAARCSTARGRQNTAQASQAASNTPSCWDVSSQSLPCATAHRCSYAPVKTAPTNSKKRAAVATPIVGVIQPVWRQKVYLEPTFRPKEVSAPSNLAAETSAYRFMWSDTLPLTPVLPAMPQSAEPVPVARAGPSCA